MAPKRKHKSSSPVSEQAAPDAVSHTDALSTMSNDGTGPEENADKSLQCPIVKVSYADLLKELMPPSPILRSGSQSDIRQG